MDGRSTSLSARPHRDHEDVLRVAVEGLRAGQEFRHEPVLLAQVVELFGTLPEGVLVDATLGGGGHAAALLEAFPDRRLLGLDRDAEAIEAATRRLAPFGERVRLFRRRFDELAEVLNAESATPAGILFDLGVSSHQLDVAERGFSYRQRGPLDMRMDRSGGVTAAEILNETDEAELTALFRDNGEERFAARIARAIVVHRPLRFTDELAAVVEQAIPAAARRRGHPARRVFQALRVSVNDELGALRRALDIAIERIAPRGRIVVLSYQSSEDRLVKARFALGATGGCTCPPKLPCVCGAVATLRLLNRGARLAGADEIARNPRAEAVRLRAAERLVAAAQSGVA